MNEIDAALSEWAKHSPISIDAEFQCSCGAVGVNRDYRRHVIENLLRAARSINEGERSDY